MPTTVIAGSSFASLSLVWIESLPPSPLEGRYRRLLLPQSMLAGPCDLSRFVLVSEHYYIDHR
ncbi:MAG: hypothetical protein ACREX9_12455, partial [Gammaproteobacteria bacterium]